MYKESDIFFKVVGGNEGDLCHYPTRLDTYGCGCFHDCKYCYAKSLLEGWKEMSVCEDVPEHYKYWEEHFNCNPKDCCNLRRG